MPQHDLQRGSADGACGFKVDVLLDRDHGAADHTRVGNAGGHPEHHDDLQNALLHDGHDRQDIKEALILMVTLPRKEHFEFLYSSWY